MRLSDWRSAAPNREAMSSRVLAAVEPVLATLGAGHDPEVWVDWGEVPAIRYAVLAPTTAGLIVCHVRVAGGPEGPRATAKLVRWPRLQVGELSVESQRGHRLLAFQVEGIILRGVDDAADRIGAFAVALVSAADGRPFEHPAVAPPRATGRARRATGGGAAASRSGTSTARPERTATRPRSSTAPDVLALPAPRKT